MRILKLETPFLTGADVTDWQNFLVSQGVLSGPVDGVFGPATAQGTREYQQKAGLDPDGVIGPNTLSRAAADGFTSAGQALLAGMDTNMNCSAFATRLVAESKMKFVARYYSHSVSKTLTPQEARHLSDAGLQLMTVFEDKNDQAGLFTGPAGTSAATKALQLAAAVGQPAGSAIYFAVDFDPSQTEVQGPVTEYFKAAQQVLTAAATQYDMGVYGSGLTCRLIRDSGLAKFTWLAGASGFRESKAFHPHANVVQSAPQRTLFGGKLNIDDDVAQTSGFGAFRL